MRPARVLRGSFALIAGLLIAGGEGQAAGLIPPDPWKLCAQAIAIQERAQAIPKHLLSAIALAESGRKHPSTGQATPWPWSVMAEGQGRYLATKADAIAEVRGLQARGVRNIDVGCMQVNLYYHGDAFATLDQAFDPVANAAYAGGFLRDLFEASGSWQEAAGLYHSATPEHKNPYQARVVRYWADQQRLEMGGGALTAGLDPMLDPRAMAGGGLSGGTVGSRIRSPALLYSFAERRLSGEASRLLPPSRVGDNGNRLPPPPNGLPPRPNFASPNTARLNSPGLGEGSLADQGQPVAQARGFLRTPKQEAAFAARRAQYLQELREAIAQVKRTYGVQLARDDLRPPPPPE